MPSHILEFDEQGELLVLQENFNACDLHLFQMQEVQILDEHKFFISLCQLSSEYIQKNETSFANLLIDHFCAKYSKKLIISKSCYAFYYSWKRFAKSSGDARLFVFCCFRGTNQQKLLKFYLTLRKNIQAQVADSKIGLVPMIDNIEITLEQTLALIQKMFKDLQAVLSISKNLTNFLQANKMIYAPKEKIKATLIAEFCLKEYICQFFPVDSKLSQQQQDFQAHKQEMSSTPALKVNQSSSSLTGISRQGFQILDKNITPQIINKSKSYNLIIPGKSSPSRSKISMQASHSQPTRQSDTTGDYHLKMTHLSDRSMKLNQHSEGDQSVDFEIGNNSEKESSRSPRSASDMLIPATKEIKYSILSESLKLTDKQLKTKNFELACSLKNAQIELESLKERLQLSTIYNENIEQIFLELLEIAIESDYRQDEVDHLIQRYECFKVPPEINIQNNPSKNPQIPFKNPAFSSFNHIAHPLPFSQSSSDKHFTFSRHTQDTHPPSSKPLLNDFPQQTQQGNLTGNSANNLSEIQKQSNNSKQKAGLQKSNSSENNSEYSFIKSKQSIPPDTNKAERSSLDSLTSSSLSKSDTSIIKKNQSIQPSVRNETLPSQRKIDGSNSQNQEKKYFEYTPPGSSNEHHEIERILTFEENNNGSIRGGNRNTSSLESSLKMKQITLLKNIQEENEHTDGMNQQSIESILTFDPDQAIKSNASSLNHDNLERIVTFDPDRNYNNNNNTKDRQEEKELNSPNSNADGLKQHTGTFLYSHNSSANNSPTTRSQMSLLRIRQNENHTLNDITEDEESEQKISSAIHSRQQLEDCENIVNSSTEAKNYKVVHKSSSSQYRNKATPR